MRDIVPTPNGFMAWFIVRDAKGKQTSAITCGMRATEEEARAALDELLARLGVAT